jgi:5,10-methylenetetrahydrofolate reductase
MSTVRFQADPRQVVHETIDDETLVIQLTTGAYYSLRATANEAWELLAGQHSIEAVAAELARRYPDASGVEADVRRFAAELVSEQLLVPGGLVEPRADDHPVATAIARTYEPPRLERYTDMQYYLLLDPIHEVDDVAGWPQPAASGELAS